MTQLPTPDPEALAHSQQLQQFIIDEIAAADGWISFSRFMELVLYAPGLGYYAAGARKFGSAGDFVTAPEMTGLFGQALAAQVREIMCHSSHRIIEVGAGLGRLAADLLLELEHLDCLPEQYGILDLSADLRQRQQETIAKAAPHLLDRVTWLDRLPEVFSGVVLANELLDALPADVVAWRENGIFNRGVAVDPAGCFTWSERPASGALLAAAEEIGSQCQLPPGFESEISLASRAWAAEWAHRGLRRPAADRLWFSAARVLPSAARARHLDVPLPPPCPSRSLLSSRPAGCYGPRRFYGDYCGRPRRWSGTARLHQPGAVPAQLRHSRPAGGTAQ